MLGRVINLGRITSERLILQAYLRGEIGFDTTVPKVVGKTPILNTVVNEDQVGLFRSPGARKAVIADKEMLDNFESRPGLQVPTFLEAGPRA